MYGVAFTNAVSAAPLVAVSAPTSTVALQSSSSSSSGASSGVPLLLVGCSSTAVVASSLRKQRRRDAKAVSVRSFEKELGVQAPLGFFDPLGITKDGDVTEFRRLREAELKNGRVAMFAVIGLIVPEYYKFPGFLSPTLNLKFADVPNGIAGLYKVPPEGWLQWIAFCGLYETIVNVPVDPAEPGNYGKGKLGLGNMVLGFTGPKITDPEARKRSLNSELANSRLAMVAVAGLFAQEGLTGSVWGLYSGASAFETELGVQAPVGFWDPLGFTVGGDAASFRRRRSIELKHGRVAMLACLGYIVPEYSRFDGFLSPSLNLKFSDVPTGLAALSKVPGSGWAQIVSFIGTVELFQYPDDPTRPPGDFKNAGLLGIPNGFLKCPEAQKQKKLSAEIANGRLAMMAIIGMFFQDGLTGSAWGDWNLYTDSPLRSFEKELGVQAPLGFFDPAGITKDGDVQEFRRLREAELKNGRVAMFAVIGLIVPEYYKFPGFLSPTLNLKFADVPNGIAALYKVPPEGWLQWIAFCGLYETIVNVPVDPAEPGNYGKGKLGLGNMVLGFAGPKITDPEARKRSLNSELANSRLAMVAVAGLFAQEGLTGSVWGLYSGSS
jgi:light-harvesting complex I chlorophyll a/b binding protein 1